MKRALLAMLVLTGLSFEVGCCCNPCRTGMGCGPMYLGAYADDPPTCDPCDRCANFTGHCDPCTPRRPPHFRHGTYYGPRLVGECCFLKKIFRELRGDCCDTCTTCSDGAGVVVSEPGYYHDPYLQSAPTPSPQMMHGPVSVSHRPGSNCNCH